MIALCAAMLCTVATVSGAEIKQTPAMTRDSEAAAATVAESTTATTISGTSPVTLSPTPLWASATDVCTKKASCDLCHTEAQYCKYNSLGLPNCCSQKETRIVPQGEDAEDEFPSLVVDAVNATADESATTVSPSVAVSSTGENQQNSTTTETADADEEIHTKKSEKFATKVSSKMNQLKQQVDSASTTGTAAEPSTESKSESEDAEEENLESQSTGASMPAEQAEEKKSSVVEPQVEMQHANMTESATVQHNETGTVSMVAAARPAWSNPKTDVCYDIQEETVCDELNEYRNEMPLPNDLKQPQCCQRGAADVSSLIVASPKPTWATHNDVCSMIMNSCDEDCPSTDYQYCDFGTQMCCKRIIKRAAKSMKHKH